MIYKYADYVVTNRGNVTENMHKVHAAVTDATGRLLYSVGDPTRLTLARSTAKPFQTLAVLETGCVEKFGFDDADLALMCASHSSEDRHIERTRAMLAKVPGAEERHLQCGGHAPLSEMVNRAWIKRDFSPTAVCNNCSGKHVGMLAGAAVLRGEDRAGDLGATEYHVLEGPMQSRVKGVVEELSGLGGDEMKLRWGIDACNLPAPALPLQNLGHLYAMFADAADKAETEGASARTQHLARVFNAMSSHPDMVGGEGRFCTELISAFDGGLVGKLGADACYGVAVRASDAIRRQGAEGGLGIAVKIEDGNTEILYAVVMEILEKLEIGTEGMRRKLEPFHHLERANTMGVVTGKVILAFKLKKA